MGIIIYGGGSEWIVSPTTEERVYRYYDQELT